MEARTVQQETRTEHITVELNGKRVQAPAGVTLGGLLDLRGVERRMVAVEHNTEIVSRHDYDDIVLQDGDRLEIVQMVGGG